MNPRVSRSSALASKATGFPIAKIAAKLAIGYRLDEIPNDITRVTPASFEPTLDYVVVKVPRFAFEKFPGADATLTTTMKSVGEAMAIGRNYSTALQKALRSLEKRGSQLPLGGRARRQGCPARARGDAHRRPHRDACSRRMRAGATHRRGSSRRPGSTRGSSTRSSLINEVADEVAAADALDADLMRHAKEHGFSDAQIAQLRGLDRARRARDPHGLRACARSSRPSTPARASSRRSRRTTTRATTTETEVAPSDARKVVILGSGPNRIGQGIEFDYSCVHASFALRDAGLRDDHDQLQPRDGLDRLRHLRPALLRAAHARGRARGHPRRAGRRASSSASSCSSAARPPSGSRTGSSDAGVPILGTSPDAIDLAEERGAVLAHPRRGRPRRRPATARRPTSTAPSPIAEEIGYPVLVRPSFVLGGRGMEIVYDSPSRSCDYFDRVRDQAIIGPGQPLLVDRFLDDAVEIDVDALYDGDGALRRRHHGAHRGGRHPLGRLGLHPAARDPRPRQSSTGCATRHRGDRERASACAG